MSPLPPDPRRPRLTRDDSRALDGERSPDQAAPAARQSPGDPGRARAVAAYREAADLWVDDALRAARGLDVERLADRVLAGIADGSAAHAWAAPEVPWGYAAAALVLFAVGLAGLLALRPSPPGIPALDLEPGHLAVLRSVEIDTLSLKGR